MHADATLAGSPRAANPSLIRSAVAVVVGIVALTVTSFALEAVARPLFVRLFDLPNEEAINQTVATWLLSLCYTLPCVALGAYVTAWLSRGSAIKHALIYGAVEIALIAMAWQASPGLAPARNWILGMLLMLPVSWFGGWMRARQQTAS